MNNREILEHLLAIRQMLEERSIKPMSLGEAAEYLHISKAYLYKLTSKSLIVFYKPHGKIIYFLKKDLDGWILQHRSASRDELDRLVR